MRRGNRFGLPTAAVPHPPIRLPSPRPRSSKVDTKGEGPAEKSESAGSGSSAAAAGPKSVVANARPSASESAAAEKAAEESAGEAAPATEDEKPEKPAKSSQRRKDAKARHPSAADTPVQAEAAQEPAAAAASMRPRRSRTRSRPTPPPRRRNAKVTAEVTAQTNVSAAQPVALTERDVDVGCPGCKGRNRTRRLHRVGARQESRRRDRADGAVVARVVAAGGDGGGVPGRAHPVGGAELVPRRPSLVQPRALRDRRDRTARPHRGDRWRSGGGCRPRTRRPQLCGQPRRPLRNGEHRQRDRAVHLHGRRSDRAGRLVRGRRRRRPSRRHGGRRGQCRPVRSAGGPQGGRRHRAFHSGDPVRGRLHRSRRLVLPDRRRSRPTA